VAERLLDDDAGVLDEAGRGEPMNDRREQRRRRLQIEQPVLAVDALADALVGRILVVAAGQVADPAPRRSPR
jgi:hypothetical protein